MVCSLPPSPCIERQRCPHFCLGHQTLCQDRRVKGISIVPLQEKISLYADDPLLCSRTWDHHCIFTFCVGIYKNSLVIILESVLIGKSLTFVPFIPQVWGVVTHMPLQWVEEITYLGVQEQGRFVAYLEDNINFLLSQFACKYQA